MFKISIRLSFTQRATASQRFCRGCMRLGAVGKEDEQSSSRTQSRTPPCRADSTNVFLIILEVVVDDGLILLSHSQTRRVCMVYGLVTKRNYPTCSKRNLKNQHSPFRNECQLKGPGRFRIRNVFRRFGMWTQEPVRSAIINTMILVLYCRISQPITCVLSM